VAGIRAFFALLVLQSRQKRNKLLCLHTLSINKRASARVGSYRFPLSIEKSLDSCQALRCERFLRIYADKPGAELLLSDYSKFIKLAQPEPISYPIEAEVIGARWLIRHAADVSVLVSAIQAAPDWLITNNTEHFTPEVAAKTSLRIATPQQFVRAIQ
jgi:hypothetical protein